MVKNLFLSLLTFISRVFSGSVIYIVLARLMSVENFGLLSFGTTLAGMIAVLAEFGYSLMSQRDIPQERFSLNAYVFNTFIQKLIYAFLAVLSGTIYLCLFYTGNNLYIGLIFVVYAIITSNVMYLYAVFRSKNLFIIETWCSFGYAFYLIIVVSLYYLFDFNILFIVYNMLFARFLQLFALLIVFIYKFGLKNFRFDKIIQKYLFKNSISFGLHYIIGFFYFSVDSQFIAYFNGNDSLAIYQAFFKIILIILSLIDLLNNVFLPRLSMLYIKNKRDFFTHSHWFNNTIFLCGIVLFVFLNLFSSHIINILYGTRYSQAIILTIPFSLVLLFRVFSTLYAILLTISDHQRIRLIIVSITLFTNLVLNSLLIPKYSIIGAAYASSITHFLLFMLYFFYSKYISKSVFLSSKVILVLLISFATVIVTQIFNLNDNIYLASLIFLAFAFFSILFFQKEIFSLFAKSFLKK